MSAFPLLVSPAYPTLGKASLQLLSPIQRDFSGGAIWPSWRRSRAYDEPPDTCSYSTGTSSSPTMRNDGGPDSPHDAGTASDRAHLDPTELSAARYSVRSATIAPAAFFFSDSTPFFAAVFTPGAARIVVRNRGRRSTRSTPRGDDVLGVAGIHREAT